MRPPDRTRPTACACVRCRARSRPSVHCSIALSSLRVVRSRVLFDLPSLPPSPLLTFFVSYFPSLQVARLVVGHSAPLAHFFVWFCFAFWSARALARPLRGVGSRASFLTLGYVRFRRCMWPCFSSTDSHGEACVRALLSLAASASFLTLACVTCSRCVWATVIPCRALHSV